MYFLSIIVLCFLFLETFGRPTHNIQDYKDAKDNSYRDNDSDETEDYQHDDRQSSVKQFADESAPKPELVENGPGHNKEIDHARPDKDYLENEESDAAQLSHDDVSNDVKRKATYRNVVLFHDEKPQKMETNEYNEDDRVKQNYNDRYLKQYHTLHNIDRDGLIRDRRQIKKNDSPMDTGEISLQKNGLNANEDEETAIRRHVKKLSKEELEELLQSLSDDKRALLKNIIDNCQQDYGNINKREITKKAEANEENNFVGNEQSDTGKVQGGSANLEAESSIAPIIDKQDTKKAYTESMYTKNTEIPNSSSDKINGLDNIIDKTPVKFDNIEKIQSTETESKILNNPETENEAQKKENKREIDFKVSVESESAVGESDVLKSSNKEDLHCSDSEALSQLWNEESSLFNDYGKYKREVCSDSNDAVKSLEESFPNTANTKIYKIGSDMAPLIRVKRNDSEKKLDKKDEDVVSNLKVPYFSSALENNEEERDEGGEFQDDVFFDRGQNFAKSSELTKRGIQTSKDNEEKSKYCSNSQSYHMEKNKSGSETAGLGSDTDVVLSGIEGVDDNIMYNGITRNRRTGNTLHSSNVKSETINLNRENDQQFHLQNENNEISEENNNAARYQENDSFGSLPRNYEQELGRFKRIRRLRPENVPAVK